MAGSLPSAASAQDIPDLVTDRPDVTESASIVPRGWVQAELGIAHEDVAGGTVTVPGTLVRIGVGPRVEARLGWAGWIDPGGDCFVTAGSGGGSDCRGTGPGDGEAAVKLLLVERSGARPDVAVIPAVSLPVGDHDFTSDGFDPSLTAVIANDLSSIAGWGANAGLAFVSPGPGVDGDRTALAFWSTSFGIDVTDRLGSFLEYFGELPEDEPAAHAADAGFTFLATPHLQLDATAGVALNDHAPDLVLGAGLAYRLRVF